MRKRLTSKQLYTVFAIVMVIVMAVGGSGLLMPAEDTADPLDASAADTLRPPTFTPPVGTPQVALDVPYLHPSGYFEIAPPGGWEHSEVSEENVFSASWVSPVLSSVVHAFILKYDAPVTEDQFISHVESEFATGFSYYDSYTVLARDYDSDPITVDFSVSLGGQDFAARQWAGKEDELIWVLRVVAPANHPALLAYLEQNVLPSYRVFTVPRSAPIGWQTYTDAAQGYSFQHPAAWANHGTGQDGVRRFVDSATRWQSEMAIAVRPQATVSAGDDARAWLASLIPDAQVSSVKAVARPRGEGYLVSFSYPSDEGERRRGLLLLLNANDAVYEVDLRLPPGADDPLNQEARRRTDEAISVLETFTALAVGTPTAPPDDEPPATEESSPEPTRETPLMPPVEETERAP